MKIKIQGLGRPRMEIEVDPDDKCISMPKQVWACAAGSSPAPVAPVISSAVPKPPKLNARKADLNFVARTSLSMCKDPRLGIKVYTRKKNLNGRLVNTKSIVK
uniref:Uncharacterized protein n=1 Tax=Chenopodium quinoa TaxID=63459 RepID=A0A803MMA8_CHEQI